MEKEKMWKILRIIMDIFFYVLFIAVLLFGIKFLSTYKTDPCSLCQNITNKICVDVLLR